VLFHRKQHPRELGAAHVVEFLADLAVAHHVRAQHERDAGRGAGWVALPVAFATKGLLGHEDVSTTMM
jgi:hypothetical protein